jgi:REP element-mobilizing transposase RayT
MATMALQPLYNGRNVRPAYCLRYGWTGWPTAGTSLPRELGNVVVQLAELWEEDGLRLLESRCSDQMVQLCFSAKPEVAPLLAATRAKGRLQHALRKAGLPVQFSRKLAIRSVGDNCTSDVEKYIREQVASAAFADGDFAAHLRQFTVANPDVVLARPTETASGRYWYNLHVVLVTEERYQRADEQWLARIRDQSLRIAQKKRHAISCLSVMPDHLHIALRGNIDHSPQEIALSFQNNLAYALGQISVWRHTYYAGTFGEYDMQAIRRHTGIVPARSIASR